MSNALSWWVSGSGVLNGGMPGIEFTSVWGSFGPFNWQGESCALKGQSWVFYGSLIGVSNGSTSSLEFTQASSHLNRGNKPIWLTGTAKIETATGGVLKVTT